MRPSLLALAPALALASLAAPVGASEAAPSPDDDTVELGTGVGLIGLGAATVAASSFYALGRESDGTDSPGPSGGTLVAIGVIGAVAAGIGIGLVVDVATSDDEASAALLLGPASGSLLVRF